MKKNLIYTVVFLLIGLPLIAYGSTCENDADCDDSNPCTTNSCISPSCVYTPVPNCCLTDGDCVTSNPCQNTKCDFFTNTCLSYERICPGSECNLANGLCKDPNKACANDADCDDGDPCTTNSCNSFSCVYTLVPNCCLTNAYCYDENPCTMAWCNTDSNTCANYERCPQGSECVPANGECVSSLCTQNEDCDDGLFCNGDETCVEGTCRDGTSPDCDDGVDCTVDACNEGNDTCSNTADDAKCPDDGIFCTGTKYCDEFKDCLYSGNPCPTGTVCNEAKYTCDLEPNKISCTGFLPPFNDVITLKKKNRRAIPVKMLLVDDQNNPITDMDVSKPPVVNVIFVNSIGPGPDSSPELVPPGLSDDGNEFRFDPLEELWIINLATKQFAAPGEYTVTAVSGDSTYIIDSTIIDSNCRGIFIRLP